MRRIALVGVLATGCRAPLVADVAGDVPFLDWPAPDALLVGSADGLFVVDVTTGEATEATPDPVLDASLDADGRVLFVPGTIDPEVDVLCLVCESELVRVDRDGGSAEVVASELNGNVDTSFVQSPNRRHLAWSAGLGAIVRDDETGGQQASDAYVRVEDVADDGATAIFTWKSAPVLPQYGVWHDDGTVEILELDAEISRFRAYDGAHHGLVVDNDLLALSVIDIDSGEPEWVLPLDAPILAASVAWSLDGRFVSFITHERPAMFHVVDGRTGLDRSVAAVHLGGGSWNGATAVSPDGSHVAWIADGDVFVLDL